MDKLSSMENIDVPRYVATNYRLRTFDLKHTVDSSVCREKGCY